MAVDRRTFMAGVVASAVAAAACSPSNGDDPAADGGVETDALPPVPEHLPAGLFSMGVASGDPLPDSVILWTRLSPDPLLEEGDMIPDPVPVEWEVALDEDFDDVVASGTVVAEEALAHSVHVDVQGLDPHTWYWYRFTVGEQESPVGRTRTTPADGAAVDRLRFAFASCQDRQRGYWGAHEHLAEEDLDLLVFLGDYIYEYGPGADAEVVAREHQTPAATDLVTYRRRWGEYKSDPLLQAAHARFPWVCTWDDHEVAGNYASDSGPEGGDSGQSDDFLTRRRDAYQAYYEHLPLRVDPPDSPHLRIYRQTAWGDLATFFVLDTRQYRSVQPACESDLEIESVGPHCDEALEENHTMLGAEQEAWLDEALGTSASTWNVLAQQVVLAPLPFVDGDEPLDNLDQWDDYPVARRRLVSKLAEVSNPVAICGDLHAGGVGFITEDPEDPETDPVAPVLIGSSLSSTFPVPGILEDNVRSLPHFLYANSAQRGYVVCELSHEELRAEFRVVSTYEEPRAELATDATWVISSGDPVPREV